MHFHKFSFHPNFEFVSRFASSGVFKTAKGRFVIETQSFPDDIHHIKVTGKDWDAGDSRATVKVPKARRTSAAGHTRLKVHADGGFSLLAKDGQPLLASRKGRFFGQCGKKSLFEFVRQPGDRFYGFGEKWSGFEHSGKTTKFWNTDVCGDFHEESHRHGRPAPDPVYVSIPYVIVKRGNVYLGLLLDNSYATFISTGAVEALAFQPVPDAGEEGPGAVAIKEESLPKGWAGALHLGADEGQPGLYILVGPSLRELTGKLQRLVGTTPLPPAWALGYHQCRWGYRSEADLRWLDAGFTKHGIPADGLWLDIDYMDGFRVFTLDGKHFRHPAALFRELNKKGRKVIPILDPGVKREPGYGAYERGRKAGAFCKNPQGGEYVGLVWPGHTVFPDFSTTAGRKWWRQEVRDFARLGLYGAWLDMNDPSTGPAENEEMLFQDGRRPHSFYHNRYAIGMAEASRAGFLEAHPGVRPFLLCRSGSTGSGRYTAIWTGDNSSNYHHLRSNIATTLNLALSGIPFNAPDVGGFGGDAGPELVCDWFKACFLFPFLRNHSALNTRHQEPWAFGLPVMRTVRKFIRLRYRLRPYLYQLFAAQERTGEAILRPLFHDFDSTKKIPLDLIDDQFMVGSHLMQAPFVEEKNTRRKVALPAPAAWYDLAAGKWIKGGRIVEVTATLGTTPVYARDGAILPLARLRPDESIFDGRRADFHLFLSGKGKAATTYVFDDGISFDYQQGKRSEVEVSASRSGTSIQVGLKYRRRGFGEGAFTFSTEPAIKKLVVNGVAAKRCPAQGVSLSETPWTTWRV